MSQRQRSSGSSTEVVTYARAPLPVASGETIARRYTLVEHYGAGPLGNTYRAHDAHGGDVAVKIIAHELVPTAAEQDNVVGAVEKLIAHPMDPVAVPIDTGVDHGHVYVVSPWVPGRSLRRVLGAYRDAGSAMPRDEVLGVLEGVVLALRQLHTRMPHGALYPESVQIARSGTVKLTDAGIAGAIARARLIDHYEGFPDVMPYLAPEIRGGKRSSAGADLYSVGALASELLTGDPSAAAAGIAGAMMAGLPKDIETALADVIAQKASKRAAGLPSLLEHLARSIGARGFPTSGPLPRARAGTDAPPEDDVEEIVPEDEEPDPDERTTPRAMAPTRPTAKSRAALRATLPIAFAPPRPRPPSDPPPAIAKSRTGSTRPRATLPGPPRPRGNSSPPPARATQRLPSLPPARRDD